MDEQRIQQAGKRDAAVYTDVVIDQHKVMQSVVVQVGINDNEELNRPEDVSFMFTCIFTALRKLF